MSRSGYTDDYDYEDNWAVIRWRGVVASVFRSKRGQAFFKELLKSLDALPEKALIAEELVQGDQVCAIGSVGKARGIDMHSIDPHDYEKIANVFGIHSAQVQEIEFMNDNWTAETPEEKFIRMRKWVVSQIKDET